MDSPQILGILHKKRGGLAGFMENIINPWEPKQFIVSRDGVLTYYEVDSTHSNSKLSNKEPRRTINLRTAEYDFIPSSNAAIEGSPTIFVMQILPRNERKLLICVSSKEDFNRWSTIFQKYINLKCRAIQSPSSDDMKKSSNTTTKQRSASLTGADELFGMAAPPDHWQPFSEADICAQCSSKFSLMKRRHHCRICGKVFCANCSGYKIFIPQDLVPQRENEQATPQRVCRNCYTAVPAMLKIQKAAKNFLVRKHAEEAQAWKIFSDLENIEERERLQLAQFMRMLMKAMEVKELEDAVREDAAAARNVSQTSTTDPPPSASPISSMSELTHEHELELESSAGAEISPPGTAGPLDLFLAGEIVVESSLEKAQRLHLVGRDSYANPAMFSGPKSAQGAAAQIIEVVRIGRRLNRDLVSDLLSATKAILMNCTNITEVTFLGGKLVVVGDIHGQVADLLHILDESGPPSATNIYIFNGDFVDRGESGVEVMCVLLALFVSSRGHVVLNRGNHEDFNMNIIYGYLDECLQKYDKALFIQFAEVFSLLPVFCTVNKSIFIVHGGLFRDKAVPLSHLDHIDRTDLQLQSDGPPRAKLRSGGSERERREYFRELLRCALWSDPKAQLGISESDRGTGVDFGPDIAAEFMARNGLKMVIRSHQCVQRGFELPFVPSDDPAEHVSSLPLLCTIFSASNYCNADNEGAYIVIMTHAHTNAFPVEDTGLFYSVHRFSTTRDSVVAKSSQTSTLRELITRKRNALLVGFEAQDVASRRCVTRVQWSRVLQEVTGVRMRWLAIINKIAPAECLTPNGVKYDLFLDNFPTAVQSWASHPSSQPYGGRGDESVAMAGGGREGGAGAGAAGVDTAGSQSVFDAMYAQRQKLEAVFGFFDTKGSGAISREDFRRGWEQLNQRLSPDERMSNVDAMMSLMDLENKGFISLNVFFEVSRLVEERVSEMRNSGRVSGARPTF